MKLAAVGAAGALTGASLTQGAAPNNTGADPFTVVISAIPTDINWVLERLPDGR